MHGVPPFQAWDVWDGWTVCLFFVLCHSQNSFDQIRTTSLPETGCEFTSASRYFGDYSELAVIVV